MALVVSLLCTQKVSTHPSPNPKVAILLLQASPQLCPLYATHSSPFMHSEMALQWFSAGVRLTADRAATASRQRRIGATRGAQPSGPGSCVRKFTCGNVNVNAVQGFSSFLLGFRCWFDSERRWHT